LMDWISHAFKTWKNRPFQEFKKTVGVRTSGPWSPTDSQQVGNTKGRRYAPPAFPAPFRALSHRPEDSSPFKPSGCGAVVAGDSFRPDSAKSAASKNRKRASLKNW